MDAEIEQPPRRSWNSHCLAVTHDAKQRLASMGIEVDDYEMIAWATIYFRFKREEGDRKGFFSMLCAFAVSEAAVSLEEGPPEQDPEAGSGHKPPKIKPS